MKVPFAAPSSRDADNAWASSARLQNWYREPVGQRIVLKSHLGTSAYYTHSGGAYDSYPPWAMVRYDSELYWLHPDGLFFASGPSTVSIPGRVASKTDITDGVTTVPWVSNATMDTNNGKLTMTDGSVYRVYDGTTVTAPTGGAFTATSSCFTFKQYTVMTEFDGRRVQWSDPADPETIDALNFATKEGRPDEIIRGIAINDTPIIFGRKSTEFWQLNGAGNFEARFGGVNDVGLHSFGAVAKGDNVLLFVGSDGKAYLTTGEAPQAISTSPVETSIASAYAIQVTFHRDEGHKFFVLNFPFQASWVFDMLTGEWSERSEGSDFGRWPVSVSELLGSDYYVGVPGGVHKLERNNVDVSGPLIRRAVSETVQNGGDRFKIPKLEFQANVGRQAAEVQMVLRTSRDYGQTWHLTQQRGLGTNGETETRPVFRALGQYRQFTAEVTVSDPYDVILDAEAII